MVIYAVLKNLGWQTHTTLFTNLTLSKENIKMKKRFKIFKNNRGIKIV